MRNKGKKEAFRINFNKKFNIWGGFGMEILWSLNWKRNFWKKSSYIFTDEQKPCFIIFFGIVAHFSSFRQCEVWIFLYTLSAQSSVWGLWTLWKRPSGVYVSLPTVNRCKSLWRIHDTCLIKKLSWVLNIYGMYHRLNLMSELFYRNRLEKLRKFPLKKMKRCSAPKNNWMINSQFCYRDF